MGLKTALFAEHQRLGARMVDFAGWLMPLHYGSQIQEHQRVRQDAGMFDVSHMQAVDVAGAQAVDFLRYILANDVTKLNHGKALYTCMLNANGGVIDDLIVYHQPAGFRLVLNADCIDKDFAWLQQQAQAFQVELSRQDLTILAVQGHHARAKTLPLLPKAIQAQAADLDYFFSTAVTEGWCVARTGYTGEDGFEVMLPNTQASAFFQALLKAGVAPCGLGARDSLRLEAGMNLYGLDMDEQHSPLVSGLAWTVAFKPDNRNFMGRGALEQQKQQLEQKFVGVLLTERGVLRHGQNLLQGNEIVGEITSGGFSPTLNHSIGLARVLNEIDACEVDIRGKRYPIKIVKIPFVRNGQSCLSL